MVQNLLHEGAACARHGQGVIRRPPRLAATVPGRRAARGAAKSLLRRPLATIVSWAGSPGRANPEPPGTGLGRALAGGEQGAGGVAEAPGQRRGQWLPLSEE